MSYFRLSLVSFLMFDYEPENPNNDWQSFYYNIWINSIKHWQL